jgi:hypothetical protein
VRVVTGARLERLRVRARRDDADVKLHRGGIGMKLNDPDLGAILVHVFVERQELRLVRLDEGAQVSRAVALDRELACPEVLGRDEDERRRHDRSFGSLWHSWLNGPARRRSAAAAQHPFPF